MWSKGANIGKSRFALLLNMQVQMWTPSHLQKFESCISEFTQELVLDILEYIYIFLRIFMKRICKVGENKNMPSWEKNQHKIPKKNGSTPT